MDRELTHEDPHRFRAELLATMCFPENDELRQHCYTHYSIRSDLAGLSEQEQFTIDRMTIDALLESPSTSAMRELEIKATKRGVVAGDLLAIIYLMDHFDLDPEPSINKAIHCIQEFSETNTFGDNSPMWTSERTLRQLWNDMKSVSHFWAAYRLNQSWSYCDPTELFSSDENLLLFVGVSKTLADFGVSYVPKRSKSQEPILGNSRLWKVGGCFAEAPPRRLQTDRRPDVLERYLRSYSAPLANF